MRILLVTPHFQPENFKCNDVAFELQRRGHDVTVLTCIPNYPQGHFYDGYGLLSRRTEVVDGVKIVRTAVIPRGNASGPRLALNYLSYVVTGSIRACWMALRNKYDAVLVHETSPVTVGIPAVIVKKMQRIPMIFWVLDLWPESLQAAGGINNKAVLGFFTSITRWIYRNSSRLLISSKGFEKSITEKGTPAEKIHYFPNWPDTAFDGAAEYALPALPDGGFNVMFAGNIGEAQDFDHILEAARLLKARKDIHFILVGDGRKRPWVEAFVEEHALAETVHWVGRHPLAAMPQFFGKASAMLVTLKDEPIFSLTAPAKIQAYMSAGKPILAMINGEAARIVSESECGRSVNAGDAEGLARIITELAALPAEALQKLGQNGFEYCQKHFNFKQNMNNLERWLSEDTAK